MRHKQYLSTLLGLGILFGATGCSPLKILSSTAPDGHYTKDEALKYSEHSRGLLDLYEPDNLSESASTVVFFYGGGWKEGKRQEYEFVASAFAKEGFRVVIPDYRLHPEVQFPTFVEDAARAVRWVYSYLTSNQDLPTAQAGVYLMGHSSGAHIAALLALDDRYLRAQSVPVGAIRGLIGLSGPYDFLPIGSGYLQSVFPETLREASQPINYVSAQAPRTLLIHGEEDDVVEPRNSVRLAQALRSAGVPVELELYPTTNHAEVAAALSPRLEFVADTLPAAVEFIQRQRSRSGPHN